jgi:YtkA-like
MITALTALAALAIILATASTQGRNDVAAQLDRPATPAAVPTTGRALVVGPGAVNARTVVGGYGLGLTLSPNRASARQTVRVTLTRGGRALTGATVGVAYSMPSMGMPQVYASTLRQSADGSYGSSDPALAMPGTWRLSFKVAVPGHAPVTLAVDDRMRR